ncbi:NAD(P)H-dependent FMN reductase [Martelella radicis]|uniref:NAD(P)H-dependent FMN reductase n=2 Tax=Martelella radicis TaxID=1397476 RepID=A0A7W6PAQ0_9HYPH|nr:NADPH-dependent FMN reductase [Martelella radicis]MBB4121662.1 NAD(P)H-dependent FMN reductase [Martelella radicis]
MKLNIIIGSTRPGRVGPSIAKWVGDFAREHGKFEVEVVDLDDFKLPFLDEPKHPRLQEYEHEHTRKWSESVASADAFIFVTPEYDFFAPATLVNALQVVSKEWGYKPAGVVSYGGVSGGLRAAQELRTLIVNLNAHPLPQVVPIPFFPKFLGEDGKLTPNDEMKAGATGLLDELYKWAGPLAEMRKAS